MKPPHFRFVQTLVCLALTLAATSAHAYVRWYNPALDANGTLRVCYRTESIRMTPTPSYPALAELTLRYSGGTKLDRERSYPTIQDLERRTVNLADESDLFTYAYQHQLYACEVSWEYGLDWVVSDQEVSGDR